MNRSVAVQTLRLRIRRCVHFIDNKRSLSSISKRSNCIVLPDKIMGSEEERISRPPTGMRDFDPRSYRLREWMFLKWRGAATQHGFLEYDAPLLEPEEMYRRKSGEDVSKQMYNLTDRDGLALSLRPEMTPSLARMVLARRDSLSFPLKWFSLPQCWRYETTSVGRRREHFQWNMDVWGVAGVEAEAELLAAAVAALRAMGLTETDVVFKVSSRKLLNGLMRQLGVPEDLWTSTLLALDRAEKMTVAALRAELGTLGLQTVAIDALVTSMQIRDLKHFAAQLGEDDEGVRDVRRLLELLDRYGLSGWARFDPGVVRGLAYYSGVVFEAFDTAGKLRAVCGGGRYDTLLASTFGVGPDCNIPAAGFGFGDAVLEELLLLKGLLPPETQSHSVDVLLYAMDASLRATAMQLAGTLRSAGVSVDLVLDDGWKPKHAFQRGDRMGAAHVLMLAQNEHRRGEALMKNLRSRAQVAFRYEDIGLQIDAILAAKREEEKTQHKV